MALYNIEMDFTYTSSFQLEASSPEEAEGMVLAAGHNEIADITGRSFAQATECTRIVKNITEVI